jgi:hypothetical protein
MLRPPAACPDIGSEAARAALKSQREKGNCFIWNDFLKAGVIFPVEAEVN